MILKAFLAFYRLIWIALTPLLLIYLRMRARRDPVYWQHLRERFGSYPALPQSPIWIHAVSMGETRSATPLARDLLAAGETVVFTHFTPAGRAEAHRAFGAEIAQGRVASVWVPLDMFWVFGRFFRACHPKIGLTMEIEIWPAMVFAARRGRVPLFMCNAQYPNRSLARDRGGLRLRQRVMAGFAGAFVKSKLQADRFAGAGVPNIQITGELRFDQMVPKPQIDAAKALSPQISRPVVTFASAVEAEDPMFLDVIHALLAHPSRPLIIYVPRAPERFDTVAEMLRKAGVQTARRSEVFDADLHASEWPTGIDVLLGDSMGEMYFYLALADKVVVGSGFVPAGAHNIIEPLSLEKPVVTGPYTHTIEFPFVEAEAAGVAVSVPDAAALVAALTGPEWTTPQQMRAFMAAHAGASKRTLAAIQAALEDDV